MENTLFNPRIMKKSTVCSRTPNKSVMACQLQDRGMVIKTIDGSDGVLCARHEKSVKNCQQTNPRQQYER